MAFNPKEALSNAERWFRSQMPHQMLRGDEVLPHGVKERRDFDTMVEAEGRFLERAATMAEHNHHLSPSVLFTNLLNIVYPDVPGYGPQHGKNTSQLAVYCAQVNGIFDPRELEALKAAGLLHDVGRTRPVGEQDRDHARRSAEMADRFMRSDPAGLAQRDLREHACRLIAAHDLSRKDPPQDPLLRALWDADSLEAARHAPNTPRGRTLVVERYQRLLSPFARSATAQKRWLEKYGWDCPAWDLPLGL